MTLSVLYRGLLSSCNYACAYCPFAKRTESRSRLTRDRVALRRFDDWLTSASRHRWRVLFTPWGEALVRSWYRQTIIRLSHATNIELVAVQTNLSCGLAWLHDCNPKTVALWASYHPAEVARARFVEKVLHARKSGVRISVGMVGVVDNFGEIAALRAELPPDQYLWVNAQTPRTRPYSSEEVNFLRSIDPHFELTADPRRPFGRQCQAGESMFTVDAAGDMRRCHFVDQVIGNIHQPGWEAALQHRLCPNRHCHCFLGLAAFEARRLEESFGSRVLARVPVQFDYTP